MNRSEKLARTSLSLSLIGLGLVSIIYRNFASNWQPVPASVPARSALASLSGAIMLLTGAGLLWQRTEALASRVLFVYLAIWLVALQLPVVLKAPLVEVSWLGAGEIAVIATAGWVLVRRDLRIARFAVGVALIPIGLSHFVYPTATIGFVPSWLPFRAFWAYLGGAGHLAAAIGVLLGFCVVLAVRLEAAMIGAFTVLVWLPGVVRAPTSRQAWTAFLMSWMIGAGAWVVAEALARKWPTERAIHVPDDVRITSRPYAPGIDRPVA